MTDQVDGTLVALACAVVRSAVASGLWARHRLAHERRDKARRRAELLGKQTEFLSTLARVSVKDIADDLPAFTKDDDKFRYAVLSLANAQVQSMQTLRLEVAIVRQAVVETAIEAGWRSDPWSRYGG